MTAAKFIFRHLWKTKWYTFATFGLFALARVFTNLSEYFITSLFGFIGTHAEQMLSVTAFSYIAVFAALNFGANISDGIRTIFEYRMDILLQKGLLTSIFRHTHKHSSAYFATEMSGVISGKIQNLARQTKNVIWDFKGLLEEIIIPYAVALPILFSIDAGLALSILIFCIITSVINVLHCRRLRPMSDKASDLYSKIMGVIVDSFANARLVKNCAALAHERLYLHRHIKKYMRYKIKQLKEAGISNSYNILSLMVIRLTSLSILIYYWNAKNLDITQVLIALVYICNVTTPVERIGNFILCLQKEFGTIDNALNLLYKPLEITDKPDARRFIPQKGGISFRNCTFSYTPQKPLFKNFNLEIAEGEKVGLVGRSGSGKSSLIKLLLRACEVKKGHIFISGQDIADVTQFSLRQNMALIPQEPCLFNRSVKENIRFSKPSATDTEVIKAARLAHIHETITHLPDGYNSIVGDRGVKLSGGERQRIAIASAILKNAPVLILDEATSALDSESETAIQQAFKNIMKGKTVIAIAHRLSTLKNMDRIIVLDKGKIAEDGSPKELLKHKDSLFRHFYTLQSEGYIKTE